VFVLADRGTGECYVVPAKSADGSTARLLLADHEEESRTVYTDGFRAYDPLDDELAVKPLVVVHGDGEYVDRDVHVNTCESHGSLLRPWLSPHRGVSKDRLTPYLRAFQLRRQLYRKSGREALEHAIKKVL
jgi:transposase-like protein